MNDIDGLLTKGVANIIPGKDELKKLLESDKKLNVYLGIDPTATHIHLGHAVPLRKLQQFADLGHNVTFLIGDFTALIGDTSDKDSERPVLTKEQIEANFQTYKKQAEKILNFSKVNVRYNSEWLSKISLEEFIRISHYFSFGDFAGRELIAKRLRDKKHVGFHEALYPILQGYDSYFMDTDVQVGGTDQTFNMQAGRLLQKNLRDKESFVLTNPFLEGTDGRKMSKTWGNAIWLDDAPKDMYAKAMAINDNLIVQYLTLATNFSLDEISKLESQLKKGENPINIKKKLAYRIVKELHDDKSADQAQIAFEKTVQNRQLPDDLPVIDITGYLSGPGFTRIIDVLLKEKLVESKSKAKLLIDQKGIRLDGKDIDNRAIEFKLNTEHILEVGRRAFRIVVK
ncbi:MAG: tyrosine--tRNA ligase [Candidatus Levyibacteriota bacterium]|jgi:tyrosyl-tRNA synthetase